MKKGQYRDITGKKFGKLTAVKIVSTTGGAYWEFTCDCGTIGYEARLNDVQRLVNRGYNAGCGCERYKGNRKTHDKTKTREYASWTAMKARCYNKNHISYQWYGALGIKVCDRWKDSFENFIEDMGLRPGNQYSLDRIDITKDYSRDNCRWSTPKTQARNRKTNSLLIIGNESKSYAEWQEILSISRGIFYLRKKRWEKAESMLQ